MVTRPSRGCSSPSPPHLAPMPVHIGERSSGERGAESLEQRRQTREGKRGREHAMASQAGREGHAPGWPSPSGAAPPLLRRRPAARTRRARHAGSGGPLRVTAQTHSARGREQKGGEEERSKKREEQGGESGQRPRGMEAREDGGTEGSSVNSTMGSSG